MTAGKLINILSYLLSIMVNDCLECGRNGDLCICEAPEYDESYLWEKTEDRLHFCYSCEQYDCICGEYDNNGIINNDASNYDEDIV